VINYRNGMPNNLLTNLHLSAIIKNIFIPQKRSHKVNYFWLPIKIKGIICYVTGFHKSKRNTNTWGIQKWDISQ